MGSGGGFGFFLRGFGAGFAQVVAGISATLLPVWLSQVEFVVPVLEVRLLDPLLKVLRLVEPNSPRCWWRYRSLYSARLAAFFCFSLCRASEGSTWVSLFSPSKHNAVINDGGCGKPTRPLSALGIDWNLMGKTEDRKGPSGMDVHMQRWREEQRIEKGEASRHEKLALCSLPG